MGSKPVPDAEKKRTKNSGRVQPIKGVLLRPKTWTTMLAILRAIYGIIRMGTKIWEMFT